MASDNGSDYGWDIDLDEDVHALLDAVAESTAVASETTTLQTSLSNNVSTTIPQSKDAAVQDDDAADAVHARVDTRADRRDGDGTGIQDLPDTLGAGTARLAAGPGVAYPDLSRLLTSLDSGVAGVQPTQPQPQPQSQTAAAADTRSPLARFRAFPRKPLSVSDLTSGAWCEVQYEYTLTRLPGGRRTRTAAMKGGTRVHARLEDEVHTTVRVDATTREDYQGIKMWNMIQGLRTLRETGLTRELEIWGVVPGMPGIGEAGAAGGDGTNTADDDDLGPQLVNGIIDALSYHNPDPAFEELLESSPDLSQSQSQPVEAPTPTRRKRGRPKSPATPTTSPGKVNKITDFFASQTRPRTPATPGQVKEEAPPPPRRIYITDIKTRGTDSLPTGAAVRPTKVQLFLYHRFLSDLAADKLDFDFVFRRLRLNADTPFSDEFLAQIGAVHEEVFYDAANDSYEFRDVVDADSETARYRTLRALVGLLREEVALTFPQGANSIGSIVAVEYRMRAQVREREEKEDDEDEDDEEDDDDEDYVDPDAGRCIGTNVIPVDEALLERYLAWYMAWWRGQRPAVGVQIEEVGYKCRLCEFGDDCEWRIGKAEEHKARVRGGRGA